MLSTEQSKLVEDNIGLISGVIKKLPPFDYDEDFASGQLGLCKAAIKYNSRRGAFSTYAYHVIYNEIIRNRRKMCIRTESLDNNITQEKIDSLIVESYESECAKHKNVLAILLNRFPRYKKIIMLLIDGKSYSEIAALTHSSRQNIDRVLFAMRTYLLTNGIKA